MMGAPVDNFYPRSPCGERPTPPAAACGANIFLSTLSLRRATAEETSESEGRVLSIHALLAESDAACTAIASKSDLSIHALLAESDERNNTVRAGKWPFYPRSPCGERPWKMWRNVWELALSIHALLAESDGGG